MGARGSLEGGKLPQSGGEAESEGLRAVTEGQVNMGARPSLLGFYSRTSIFNPGTKVSAALNSALSPLASQARSSPPRTRTAPGTPLVLRWRVLFPTLSSSPQRLCVGHQGAERPGSTGQGLLQGAASLWV